MHAPAENQDDILTEEQQKTLDQFRKNLETAVETATQRIITNQEIDFHSGSSGKSHGKTIGKHKMEVQISEESEIRSSMKSDSFYVYWLRAKVDSAGSWKSNPEFLEKLNHALQVLQEGEMTPVLSGLTQTQRRSMALVFRQMLERIGSKLIDPSQREYWLNDMMQKIRSIMLKSSDPSARKKAEERNRRLESMILRPGDLAHASALKSGILKNGMFAGEVLSGKLDNANQIGGKPYGEETTFFLDFFAISTSHTDLRRFNQRLQVASFPEEDNEALAYIMRPDAETSSADETVTSHNFLLKPKGRLIHNFPDHGSEDHVAVYIGMPSTNICGIIVGGKLMARLEEMKKELAENYWYIPIFDHNMKPLFPYEEYLQLKQKNQDVR